MKKRFAYRLSLLCILLIFISISVVAADPVNITLQINSRSMTINGYSREMDVAPFIDKDRTLVPVKFISEALSASVYWLPETSQVRIVEGGKEIILAIGSTRVLSSGVEKQLSVPARIVDGRTFVPLRFVSEELGAEVVFNPATYVITIKR